ncbi:uncharacterized protein LOC115032809 [Mus caroli]|uniref:Uncharacterized protein LOC115032809 n=1 Tax=Mus caroli TaxID=10089 RepID=A0A6P7RXE1_MUSCR|nr:uncharacterized protein LOC115032809 [Mus caroli]
MCVKTSSSSLGGGVSPNTSSLPQGSWGGSGLLSSSSSPEAERRWPPGSAGKRQLRAPGPWGDPVRSAARMEETSSGAGATGDGLPPQLGSPTAWRGLHAGPASGRGLRLGSGSRSRGTRLAQQGNARAGAVPENLRRHGRSLSLPFNPGANRKPAARPSDRQASGPMNRADGEPSGK